jgi:O-antigen ligase
MIRKAFLSLTDIFKQENLIRFLKIGLVILVPIVMAGIGYALPHFELNLRNIAVLLLPFLIPPAIWMIKKPLPGFFFILPSGILVPFMLGTGSASAISFSIILLVTELGILFLNMFQKKIQLHRIEIILLIYAVVVLLSFGFGQLRWYPTAAAPLRAQLGGVGIFILSFLGLYLSGNRIVKDSHLAWLLGAFIAGGGFFVTIRAIPGPWNRVADILFYQGALGSVFWIWMVSACLSIAIAGNHLRLIYRVIAVWVMGVCFYLTFYLGSDWVSGWLPPFIAVAIILLFYKPKLIMVFFAIGVAGAILKWDSIVDMFMVGDNPYSLSTRLAAWEIMLEVIKVSPFLGLGPANYHYYTPLFSIMGYSVRFNSHNNYIDIIAQTGLVGFAVFAWFAIELVLLVWRLWSTKSDSPMQNIYLLTCTGGIAATLISGILGDWFLPFVYNVGLGGMRSSLVFWIFAGGVVAIDRMKSNQTIETSS